MFDAETEIAQSFDLEQAKSHQNYVFAKRLLDLSIAILLIGPISVVLGLSALAIKLTSGGPVFFKQTRYGLHRHPFEIIKLRTMNVCENGSDITQAQEKDPRVTPVGRVLRKLSIDELPQIWNVLIGDMSIIGPRPHAKAHDEIYGRLIANYNQRFDIKPGITGLAQVRGYRGPTPDIESMAKRINADIEYISRASIRMDMIILVKTIAVVLRRTNAY
jgi:lipopolysaccharide/colanic/teichoic acid biosynthesis glycosyltransferase